MISRFSVHLNAESGRKMSSEITEMIYKDAIALKDMQQYQVGVLMLCDNNLRKEQSPGKVLAMIKRTMIKVRRIQRFHLVIASLIPTTESAAQDAIFKQFDLDLEEFITFPHSTLNMEALNTLSVEITLKKLKKH